MLDGDGRRAAGVGRGDADPRRVVGEAADDAEVGDRDSRNFRVHDLVEHGHDRRLVQHRDVAHAVGLHPFERQRDALADADAHGREA